MEAEAALETIKPTHIASGKYTFIFDLITRLVFFLVIFFALSPRV